MFGLTRLALLIAVVSAPLLGQLTVWDLDYSTSVLATGLTASGESLAVDRYGNVYVADNGGTITRISPAGTVNPAHATGFGTLGQLATNPQDGLVYAVEFQPILPVIMSHIWRIEPTGGRTQVANVPVIATGFTINDQGLMYLGGGGVSATGLHEYDPQAGALVYRDAGFGQNAILQAVVSGDVLIASGNQVERWIPGTIGTVPYFTTSINPNQIDTVPALTRAPFNKSGKGAMVALNSFSTLGLSGTGYAFWSDLVGQSTTTLASEPYGGLSPVQLTGLRSIATGFRQDLYWYTDAAPSPGTVGSATLYHIQGLGAVGANGSLLVQLVPATDPQNPFAILVDVFGPAGSPFLFGAVDATLAIDTSLFIPAYGLVDPNPFHPFYALILDGPGIFGMPNPFATLPNTGHFHWTVPVPLGLVIPPLKLQALIVAPQAPNALFYISNHAWLP